MSESALQLMIYHPIKEIWFYLLAATVLAALAGYAWQYRRAPAALYWVLSLYLRAVFLMALVLVTVSPGLADKVFWVKIQQMSAIATLPTFFLFVVNVAGKKGQSIRRVILVILALTAFGLLALLTTGWHGWFWRGVIWDGVTFGIIRGPIYWVMMGIIYLQFFAIAMVCVIWGRRVSGLRRLQVLTLPVDPLISVTGHILWVLDVQVGAIPPLPLAFMLSGIAWSWLFFRLRVLNLMALAESTVIGNIDDCMIITDDQDYIMEINSSAQRRFGQKAPVLPGSHFPQAFACWPAMTALLDVKAVMEGEVYLEGSGYYSYHVTPLLDWGNMIIGKAIVFHDMTKLKQAQAQILDQQKALSIMAERERLGRELHDGRGQIWNYINLKLQMVRSLLNGSQLEKADQEVQRLIGTIKDLNTDARETIVGLKMTVDDGEDFVANLQDYLEWYEESNGIVTQLILPDESVTGLLSRTSKVQLLRIIQEALTNIRKHAQAQQVKVEIERGDNQVTVLIEDDGCGFDPANIPAGKKHFGLQIMAERANEAGGRLQIESRPGAGTKLIVQFNLGRVDNDENTGS
ncbi:histidine kinase N-terminal 7TM domain-containing protein [Sporomusa malonica]|nr:histidine kinase N-terminal 7TM domain-containing protein [Sporomusa malonica]